MSEAGAIATYSRNRVIKMSYSLLTREKSDGGAMLRVRFCWTVLFVVATATLAACGGGSTPISVSLSPSSPQAIDQGAFQNGVGW